MKRRTVEPETQAAAAPPAPVVRHPDTKGHATLAHRLVAPASREQVEEQYVSARDAWTKAMRAASSGRPADLASLAIAQEAYETIAAERERWISGARVAIPIESGPRRDLEAAVGQEMAWRKVHNHDKPEGLLGRLKRRIGH